MRLIFFFLFLALVFTGRTDVLLTRGVETREWTETSAENLTKTTVTFNYGGLQVSLPRAANWLENPILLRPQLLLLRCGPLSSPSTVHLELLADVTGTRGEVMSFRPLPRPGEEMLSSEWTPITNALSRALGSQARSRTPPPSEFGGEGWREEVHLFESSNMVFRLRFLLSPKLDKADEKALREAMPQLQILPPVHPPQR